MRNNALQFVFVFLTLALGGAAEALLPKPVSVGFPVLLTAAQFFALRSTTREAAGVAVAAGAVEDALSALPPMTSASFFLAVAAMTRWSEQPRGVMLLAYPLYQLWLIVWVSGLSGNVFHRLLVSAPVGFVTALVVVRALAWVERRAALDDAE